MSTLHDFFILLFFITLCGLLVVSASLINFILLGELVWISLFSYTVVGAGGFDSLVLFIWGVFLLCLAASESTIGLSLILYKSLVFGSRDLKALQQDSYNYLGFLN